MLSTDEAAVKQGKNLIRLAFGSPALETNPLVGVHFDLRYGPLNEWLLQLQKDEHRPRLLTIPDHPMQFDLIITSGAFDGLRNALHCLMNEDDSVILETEVFGNVTTAVQLYGTEVGVAHDDQGIIPGHLEQLLSTWPQTHPGRPLPKAVYVITAGNNPTGYNWSEQRMVDIYSVCRKYNILILEDGAYYFLQFGQVVIYNVLNHWGYETFQEKVTAVAELYRKKAMFVEQVAQKHLKVSVRQLTRQRGDLKRESARKILQQCDLSHH
ncbi:kynurenine/alpha-aminoadipate aminotransferase, mitochondrial-like [Aplysia californica]|uniref:Kynurenine/alpha-aminoadipate aminotransferase, mitochondrial-like n=1 Tax=Aplysia californica TaxID=6500 RepID=A0ABM1VWS0_APLCA|nr:kynurenine/alpha-aminoadipate aminotransferase, mitochondrial-like [Aplysia californica]